MQQQHLVGFIEAVDQRGDFVGQLRHAFRETEEGVKAKGKR
jgi:hypothetical protein